MGKLDEYIESEYVRTRLKEAGVANFTCIAAEESVLRKMLKSTDVSEDVCLDLSGTDFSNHDYGRLFNVVQTIVEHNRPVDEITVTETAKRLFPKNADKIIQTMTVLTKYKEKTVDDTRHVTEHVKIVKDLSTRRKAIANFDKLTEDLHNPEKEINSILAQMQEAIDGIDTVHAEWMSMEEVLLDTFGYLEKRSKGEIKSVTSGIGNLDTLIGGFFDGEMTIIGARPSVGKSAFGMNVALKAADEGLKVGFVSCEMGEKGIGQRLLSNASGVDGMKLRKAELDSEDWDKLVDGMAWMGKKDVSWLYNCNAVEDVIQTVRRKARHGELDMVIVDYLQFMDTRRLFKEERLRVGYITKQLKRLAQTANIPVVVLSQLTREGEGSMPTMKMLRESGNIEQDADGIIFLHTPKDIDDKSVDPRDRNFFENYTQDGKKYLCLGVAKQRNGAVGQVCVIFDPKIMKYMQIARSKPEGM